MSRPSLFTSIKVLNSSLRLYSSFWLLTALKICLLRQMINDRRWTRKENLIAGVSRIQRTRHFSHLLFSSCLLVRTNGSLSSCSHLWPLLPSICWQRSILASCLTKTCPITTRQVAAHNRSSLRKNSAVPALRLRSTAWKCNVRYRSFFAGNYRIQYLHVARLLIRKVSKLQLYHLLPSLDKESKNSSYHSRLSTRLQKKPTLNSFSSSLSHQLIKYKF